MEPISILIVDDHHRFRETCRDMLQENKLFHVVACTGNAEEALSITRESAPEITLLDINMPVNGYELAKRIKVINPLAKIIGLSLHAGTQVAKKLLQCGAKGYVTKSSSIEELSEAIIRIHNGEIYFSKEIQGKS